MSRSWIAKVHADLIREKERGLREIPPDSRETVITALSRLLSVFKEKLGQVGS